MIHGNNEQYLILKIIPRGKKVTNIFSVNTDANFFVMITIWCWQPVCLILILFQPYYFLFLPFFFVKVRSTLNIIIKVTINLNIKVVIIITSRVSKGDYQFVASGNVFFICVEAELIFFKSCELLSFFNVDGNCDLIAFLRWCQKISTTKIMAQFPNMVELNLFRVVNG